MSPVRITIVAASLLSACTATEATRLSEGDPWRAAPPSEKLINHIEGLLAERSCVGNINGWARFYEWRQTKYGIDTSVVKIDLRQAGVFGFESGRSIRSRDPALGPGEIMITADDRDYLVAFGSYHRGTDRLELDFCGRNRN